ncbi:phage tail-collar fiber domain-containing protein [Companilactobacillus hulinensis]|uniref:phage tail-collar fiber domain-containing protein n=1 Tax=Companilactobacillus hulinensis TaxID=2486007 RepID=UPI000F7BADF5|nr:phage tail protein [Companilactobacillus hulinensis]
MAEYNETILTAAGLDLASRAANGKTKFSITRAAATETDLSGMSESELQALKLLPNEVQAGTIDNQNDNVPNANAVIGTEILFTNDGIEKSYVINGIGLYAKEDGSNTEILYAINTAISPETMPDFADQVLFQFRFTIYVVVGRTENVTVNVDPTGMASKEYVNIKIDGINTDDTIGSSEDLSTLIMMNDFLED